jgi:catechol 2,3-dioxygenase-like lactoylglutathione lyase family enzyme
VPVTDLDRARAWYCALLDVPEPVLAEGCARLEMQGVSLTLASGTGESPRRLPAVVLRTEDVAAADAFLRRHGIAVVAAGDGWLTFADPDGNTLMVRGPRG